MVLFHLQTVFEGASVNTPERGVKEAKRHSIAVPVGHDGRIDGDRTSLFMRIFGTGGTPWTTVIDKKGIVRVNGFTPGDVDGLVKTIERLRKNP